jgi:hypothetical protein
MFIRVDDICDIFAFHFVHDGMHVDVQGLLLQPSNVINSGGFLQLYSTFNF